MEILDLEDFDDLLDIGVAGEDSIDSYCSIFFFLIDWAKCNGFLSQELNSCDIFNNSYSKVAKGEMTFSDFVDSVLGGKLLTSNFSHEVQQFVSDYIELDGFTEDSSKHFKVGVFSIPSSIEASQEFRSVINKSFNNYKLNHHINPNVVNFSEPAQ